MATGWGTRRISARTRSGSREVSGTRELEGSDEYFFIDCLFEGWAVLAW